MKCCKDCRHFQDAHYSKTYVSPECTVRGADSAAFMREFVCGIEEARLYEPKEHIEANGTPNRRPAREDTC